MLIPATSPLVTYKSGDGTAASNSDGDDATNLLAYVLPANTVISNGDAILLTTYGSIGAGAVEKTLQLTATGYDDPLFDFLFDTFIANTFWRLDVLLVMQNAVTDAWSANAVITTQSVTTACKTIVNAHAVANNFISNNIRFQFVGQSSTEGVLVQDALAVQVFKNPEQASVLTLP